MLRIARLAQPGTPRLYFSSGVRRGETLTLQFDGVLPRSRVSDALNTCGGGGGRGFGRGARGEAREEWGGVFEEEIKGSH